MKLSTLRDLATIVLTLLLVPQQSRIMVLGGGGPTRWYAEEVIEVNSESWVIAKNTGEQLVTFNHNVLSVHGARHLDQKVGHKPSKADQVAPGTLAILTVTTQDFSSPERRAVLGDAYYFEPLGLILLTPAEMTKYFMLFAILIGGFCFLGYYVAVYVGPRKSEILDTEERPEQRWQP